MTRLDDPVFLVGCPRSGTTLLQLMLDAHPDVAIAPETFFVRHVWKRRRELGDPADDDALERILEAIVTTDVFRDMRLDPGRFRDAARAGPRRYPELFRRLLADFRDDRGVPRVGEKTPNHLLAMRTLEKWFANARFIHVVRDPRAVVLSWKSMPWSNGTVALDAAVWRKYLRAARRFPPRRPGRLMTVRYEHLVANPREALEQVCRFLDLPFAAEMLEPAARASTVVDVAREPWKARAREAVTTERMNRWREELSRDEIMVIEAVAWTEMRSAGYPPRTPRLELSWRRARLASARAWERVRRRLRGIAP